MAEVSERELERFFAEVAPRLETAQTLDDELDRQLARRFNVFRYLRTDEMGFSRMIADLLDPAGDHGQGAAFLKLLTEKLDFAQDVNPSDLSNAKVQTERQIDVRYRGAIAGRRRVDIVVEIDSEHCLAIENKSNFAGDQERQVADDLDWLKREYRSSLLVYLSPTGDGPKEKSVPRETIEELGKTTPKRLVIMPCNQGATSSGEFDNLRLQFSLADWLADCRRNCDIDRLRSYLRETETYCRQRYGGNIVTESKKSAVADFVYRDSRDVATAMAVHEMWPELAQKIKYDFLDLILRHLKEARDERRLPEDMDGYRGYGKKRAESYIYIYRKSWRPFIVDGQEWVTTIYMRAEASEGTNWDIGVYLPAVSRVSEEDREKCQKLHEEIEERSKRLGKKQDSNWPWWEWVDEEYRHWNSLIPQLHEEVKAEGGEITTYFVRKFQEIDDKTRDIIDRICGSG